MALQNNPRPCLSAPRRLRLMNNRKIRLIVNAIPLTNVSTGISRYLRCLYENMERLFRGQLQISYFDGSSLHRRMPDGPPDLGKWSAQVDFFWKLPVLSALSVRIGVQFYRELLFRRAARGYDLYHEAAFFPFAKSPGLKTVFTLHDLSLLTLPRLHPQERVLFARLFFERRCQAADHILTDSEFIRGEIEELLHIPKTRLTTVPLAHDCATYYPRPVQEVSSTVTRFSLPERYFVAVGSGDPRKNMKIIPKALKRAKLKTPLVVVGWSGWVKTKEPQSGVISLGYVNDEDLARLYSGALALVYPSIYEGFGLPLVEAMACGCPIVCSCRASIPEVAGDAAVYLNNPYDCEELADLLRDLESNPTFREQLSRKGKERATRFSWEKTAEKTFEAFSNVVDS